MEELKSLDLIGLITALVIAIGGIFSHYFKKWLRGETEDGLIRYLFGGKAWKHTIGAVIAVVTTVVTMYAGGQVDLATISGLATVFLIGYAGDSALNKDSQLNGKAIVAA